MSEDQANWRGQPPPSDADTAIQRTGAVIAISGLPGSGKTTLAHRLAVLLHGTAISTEDIHEILRGRAPAPDDRDMSADEQKTVYAFVDLLAYHVARAGGCLVIAGVFRDSKQRLGLLRAVDGLCALLWVELTASEAVAINRLQSRLREGSPSPSGPKGYLAAAREYQPQPNPILRLNTDQISPDQVASIALEAILRHVSRRVGDPHHAS